MSERIQELIDSIKPYFTSDLWILAERQVNLEIAIGSFIALLTIICIVIFIVIYRQNVEDFLYGTPPPYAVAVMIGFVISCIILLMSFAFVAGRIIHKSYHIFERMSEIIKIVD